jgi:molybdate transport system ATP-binding protein
MNTVQAISSQPITLKFQGEFAYPSGFRLEFAFESPGPVTALWGPSGAGKTTLLNLIAGVLTPRSGQISVGERTYFDSKTRLNLPLHQRRLGYVFQDFQLFPHLTVEGNLRYGARRSPAPLAEFQRLIEVLDLAPLLKRFPGTLSGGEKQRTALGRAIAGNPELLLLDEPLSALDLPRKAGIVDYLSEVLREFQIPTLLVTHDEALLQSLNARRIEIGKCSLETQTRQDASADSVTP